MSTRETIRELVMYALSKKGAQLSHGGELLDEHDEPSVDLARATWGEVFAVTEERDRVFARLPVLKSRLEEHILRYDVIGESSWKERDGHAYMLAPLDADLPVEFLKSLIDEAYDLVWKKLDEHDRFCIECVRAPFDEGELIDRLIDNYGLQSYREAIRTLPRPGILLRTTKSAEANIPLGATKIGGMPDLPSNSTWPVFRDGKPLAFLGQIDLAEIAKHGTIIDGLPTEGLLSLFSVWGWLVEGDADPRTPDSGWEDQAGWTVILHSASGQRLTRLEPALGVNSFPAATVEPTPILSLPNGLEEPPVEALGWTDEEFDRFDEIQMDYRSIQNGYWFKDLDSLAGHHQLGGYALFQQEFPEELLEMDSTMLLQIGTDFQVDMCWGDGGELTLYADAGPLRKGRFECIWGSCQGG